MTDFLTYTTDLGGTVSIACDIITSSDFEKSWQISEHPVERGTPVSDNITPKNDTLTVKIRQSETPLYDLTKKSQKVLKVAKSSFKATGLLAATEAVGDAVGSLLGAADPKPLTVITYDRSATTDYVNKLEDELTTAGGLGAVCEVTVKNKTRGSLAIESIVRSDARGAAEFTVTFRQRRVVSTSFSVDLPLPSALKPKVKKGVKKSEELSAAEKGQKKSLLAAGLDKASSL